MQALVVVLVLLAHGADGSTRVVNGGAYDSPEACIEAGSKVSEAMKLEGVDTSRYALICLRTPWPADKGV